jgi:hypothetical protein
MAWLSRQATAALLLFTTIGTLGCASTAQVESNRARTTQFVADQWPTWAGGEPADAPARGADSQYPNVLESPSPRPSPALSLDQQTDAAADLNALRSRVSDQVKAAQAFDDKNTATALSEMTKGQLAVEDRAGAAPNAN